MNAELGCQLDPTTTLCSILTSPLPSLVKHPLSTPSNALFLIVPLISSLNSSQLTTNFTPIMAKISRACILLLRFLAMAATISAAAIMATSHETTTFFNITIKAEFYHTPSFTFFLVAYSIAGAYSLLTLFVPPAGLMSRWVIVFDVIIAMLLTAAMAAAGAISQVGKKGNEHAGWLPICDEVSKYCNQIMWALISGFIGLLLYTILVIHTITTELNPLLP